MLKVLFCGLANEYGRATSGPSFEYQNFYDSLQHMPGVECDFFATDAALVKSQRDQLNADLVHKVEEGDYDLLFCFLFTEELKKETIQYITKNTRTKTFNWFADDHWRFHIFSKFWAPLFTAVATTDSLAIGQYEKLGINNVIHSQWGVNPRLFFPKPAPEPNPYKLTFVGQNYSVRQKYITALEQAGLPVVAYGTGWPTGRIPKEQSGIIWSNSSVNLNFTESNYDSLRAYARLAGKLFVKKELGKYKLNVQNIHNNIRSATSVKRPQIKSRNFEIPGCGGFLLTGDADNLSDYYEPEKEIAIFHGTDDLITKARYYLENESESAEIAKAGYERTLKEHTYEQRFQAIFEHMGL